MAGLQSADGHFSLDTLPKPITLLRVRVAAFMPLSGNVGTPLGGRLSMRLSGNIRANTHPRSSEPEFPTIDPGIPTALPIPVLPGR